MDKVLKFFRKKPIIAKFVVDKQINAASMQKLLKDVAKASNSKKKI